jgi:hypothetical protein
MLKTKPRQFIIMFRTRNMIKCNKDVNDFNPNFIATFNKYFL